MRIAALFHAVVFCTLGAVGMGAALAQEGQATVLARVSVEGIQYLESFSLRVRRGGTREDAFMLTGWSRSHDGFWDRYYEEGEKGSLASQAAAPGEYEIHGFHARAGGWGGMRSFSAEDKLSYRFKVEAGKPLYLGNVHFRFQGDRGITNEPAPGLLWIILDGEKQLPFEVVLRDTQKADFEQLPKGIAPESVQVRLLQAPAK